MKNLDRYLEEVKKGIPDIETRLNAGVEGGRLEQLARKVGGVLPAQLLELYRRFDGEDMAKGTGFLAGLQRAEAFGKSAGAVTICQYIGAGAGSEGRKASVGFEKGGSIALAVSTKPD